MHDQSDQSSRTPSPAPPHLDAAAITRLVPMSAAIDALEAVLTSGLDPEAEPARGVVGIPGGQLLMMPSATASYAGVKLATVTPANPDRGLPRIQGLYVLLDGVTHAPLAMLDGIALTSLRTPAVTGLAIRRLAVADTRRLLVFGTGPQAWGHVEAVRTVRPALEHVDVVARNADRVAAFADRCRAAGLSAAAATPDDVAHADVVCCCTTARTPLFDSALLPAHTTVAAVGSHEPDAREVDAALVGRATVVAESHDVAARECGDLLLAAGEGAFDMTRLHTLAALVRGEVTPEEGRPRLFKSAGMAWEDLGVAAAVYEGWAKSRRS
ncbi:ornithine cyclodeaminase [Streptomyces sp. WAC 01529]|uniref:ornithine cyclodeaminase family protein n=1 Tax=Streptomyces sp. WAC 01529 TaxID=2203205 RepID=UPI000F6D8E0A|nr:ornithine cyclodeaminase family protein [Streptomyces sp. WAC 01529]AZM56505.1 ornithine cyclodeaminase [Streptomyces sp. WAC 01529]